MTGRMVLVETADTAPDARPNQVVVVMDTSWRPDGDARTDLVPLGPAVGRVLAARDLFAEARVRLDGWAAAVDLDAATTVDGFAWWYRYRLSTWLTLTRALHWSAVLAELSADAWPTDTLELPPDEPTLPKVAALLAGRDGFGMEHRSDPPAPARTGPRPPSGAPSPLLRLRRRVAHGRLIAPDTARDAGSDAGRETELRRRRLVVQDRIERLRQGGQGRLLVLVAPSVAQRADGPGGERLVDPFLQPVVSACAGTALDPVLLAVGSSVEDDVAWSAVEADPRLLPATETLEAWGATDDLVAAREAAARVAAALEGLPTVPLTEGGVDLAEIVQARLVRFSRTSLARNLVTARRSGRLVAELGMAGVLLYNEYNRRDYIVGARAAGVPSFAVQHGIIYPGHVGYVQRRTPAVALPTRTFVYGPYEADVLRSHGGYREEEVVVTGSPRLSLVAGGTQGAPLPDQQRELIRTRLGVAPGDRMVVISTTHERMHRRFYWANALRQLLDGPLPGTHLVFKQHPSESDDGGYRELVEAIARQAGAEPPPVTVVRDIDLYSLLRAADAHLGLFSTVLTDAVAAGTPNLVATTQARQDLLGYVAADVAVPVSSNDELRSALESCRPPDAAARAAFLARHLAPGDAPSRIRDAVLATTAGSLTHAHG